MTTDSCSNIGLLKNAHERCIINLNEDYYRNPIAAIELLVGETSDVSNIIEDKETLKIGFLLTLLSMILTRAIENKVDLNFRSRLKKLSLPDTDSGSKNILSHFLAGIADMQLLPLFTKATGDLRYKEALEKIGEITGGNERLTSIGIGILIDAYDEIIDVFHKTIYDFINKCIDTLSETSNQTALQQLQQIYWDFIIELHCIAMQQKRDYR